MVTNSPVTAALGVDGWVKTDAFDIASPVSAALEIGVFMGVFLLRRAIIRRRCRGWLMLIAA